MLVYDHSTATLLELAEYEDGSEALVAWGRREHREHERPELEVRLISAPLVAHRQSSAAD